MQVVKQSDLDGDEAVKTPVVDNSLTEKEAAALDKVRRHKNVFVPKGASLEFVPGTLLARGLGVQTGKISLIGLEGKSITPHRGNTVQCPLDIATDLRQGG